MSEAVKVVVRCRPMNSREKEMSCMNVVSMDPFNCMCYLSNPSEPGAPRKCFRFDGVYGETCTTEQIYNEVAYPLIEGVPEGYNCTVFAYGQTGCGKSFTMQGPRSKEPANRGIVPRALEQLFEAAAVSSMAKFLLTASFLEIHNEEIRDLLNPHRAAKLELREHPERGVYVHELSSHAVHNRQQCFDLMERGWAARAVGATLMNADSSRSHSIFCVNVERMELRGDNVCGNIRRGKLNLVDLAGSERQAKTGASGERLKEATKINLSLSALGNVISALVDGRSKHIPYRDSKLTRLLQDSLGGNTKTLMIACLSPADYNYDETLSTLRYAHRAKSIENSPRVNEDPKDALLRQYQQEIDALKRMLSGTGNPDETSETPAADHELCSRYEQQVAGLRAQCEAEQRTNEQLQHDLEALRSQYTQHMAELTKTTSHVHDATANTSPLEDGDVKMTSPATPEGDDAAMKNLTALQKEVLTRLHALQSSMVGGELAHDEELKARRLKQRGASERRLKALASALVRKDDDDAAVLQVYDDIEQELAAKGDALRRAKAKLRAQEREINDLQKEFETERTDYLEAIRRQDRMINLHQQITAKMVTVVKSECNYSDIEQIKAEAVWNDDTKKWKLPEVVILRTKLPPAGNITPPKGLVQPACPRAPSRTAPARIDSAPPSPENKGCSPGTQDALMQKLERSEQENLAGTYFKPKRATELLIKAQEEAGKKASQQWKEAVARSRGSSGGGMSISLSGSNGSPLQPSITLASLSNHPLLHSPWGTNMTWAVHGANISPDLVPIRKPARLEALPILESLGNRKRCKAELNTMDVI